MSSSVTRGLQQAAADDVRVRVREQTLHEIAIRATSKRLALTERDLAPAPEVGDPIEAAVSAASVGRFGGMPDQPAERKERRAGGFFSHSLHEGVHPLPVQRIDDGNECLPRRGLGLLGRFADRVEDTRQDLERPGSQHARDVGCPERGVGK